MRKFVDNKPIASCLVIEAIFLTSFLIMYQMTKIPVDENTIANAMGYSFANLLGVVPYIILLFILLRNQNIKRIQINYTR